MKRISPEINVERQWRANGNNNNKSGELSTFSPSQSPERMKAKSDTERDS